MESFEAKISAKIRLSDNGCWIWLGAANNKGYGHMWYEGTYWTLHRFMYTLHNGDIPLGMVIRHKCNVKICCNPDHLLIGWPLDNVHDQIEMGTLKPPRGKLQPIEHYRKRYV